MLAETEPDIVSVCTPDETHFEVIRTIIESSSVKAIFAEKPLATNLKDAENVVSLASERGVILAVNYIRRYAKKIVELQGFINAESFGGIQAINGYYTKGTFHNGTHWFDLARLLIGEIKRVKGFDIRKETNDDPSLDAVLEFPEGVFGYVHACDSQKFSIFEMDIIGNNGRICIKESGQTIEISHVGENPYYSGYNSLLLSDVYTNSMQNTLLNAVEDLVLCLETGKLPDCSGNDGVAAIRIAGAIRQSALSGQWVSTE
jgi:predicted dehydrogenase